MKDSIENPTIVNNKYQVGKQFGSGAFGEILMGK